MPNETTKPVTTSNEQHASHQEAKDCEAIMHALAAPFDSKEVKWKPQAVKNNSCLAVAYVDVRVIQDRLDEVLGVAGWQDEYQLLPDSSVMCRLQLKIGTPLQPNGLHTWITKMDVGSPSEQPDGGDRLKAAFSDALKRAAVKFGIARYLYRLPLQWVDYDPVKKKIVNPPKLPEPVSKSKIKPSTQTNNEKPKPEKKVEEKSETIKIAKESSHSAHEQPNRLPTVKMPSVPANGRELHQRLRDKDTLLAQQGRCLIGALLAHVTQAGVKAGYTADMEQWTGPAIDLAIEQTKSFMASLPPAMDPKAVA
jgi:hypothetical protein